MKDYLIKPTGFKKEPSFDMDYINVNNNNNIPNLLGDDEHSLMKSINFYQNSNLNNLYNN